MLDLIRKKLSSVSSGSRSLALETVIAFFVRIIGTGAAFLMNLALTRALGAEQSGYFLLCITIVTFLAAASRCGLDNIVLKHTGASAPSGAIDTIRQVMWRSLLLTTIVSSICATIIWFLAEPIATQLFDKPQMSPVLKSISPGIVGLSLITLIAMSLQGMRKVPSSIFTLSISINLILITCLLLSLVTTAAEAGSAYTMASLSTIGIGLLIWFGYTLRSPNPDAEKEPINWGSLLSSAWPLWIVLMMTQVIQWSGQFVAGIYVEPEEIAQLAVAQRTAMLASFILTAVNLVVAPRFAAMYKNGNLDGLEKTAITSVKMMLVAASPIIAIMLIFPHWLMGLFGDDFVAGAQLLQILAFGQFVNLAAGPVSYLLMMSGHEKDMRNTLLIVTPLSIGLCFALIPVLGVTGSALATAIGISLRNLLAVYWVYKRLGFNTLAIWK